MEINHTKIITLKNGMFHDGDENVLKMPIIIIISAFYVMFPKSDRRSDDGIGSSVVYTVIKNYYIPDSHYNK